MSISDHTKYRFLETIPGILIWTTFILGIVFSFIKPLWVIYFIILFDLYWLTKILYLSAFLLVAFVRFRRDSKINWLGKCQQIEDWQKIYHLIILPTVNESKEVIESTFQSLLESNYPEEKMIVVFAAEGRFPELARENKIFVQEKYGHHFFKLLTTEHPDNIPGELKGKGANETWAAQEAKKVIDELNIPYQDIIVSCFDIDTIVHSEYFGCLAYKYLTSSKPTRTSYQPVPLFNNNIWDAPAIMRVASYGTTFWLMSEQVRPERLLTFSSHSMSFQALVDVGFWQTDIVSEDSRIFVQCLLEYDGDYQVAPIYLPVSMDAVMGKTWWRSLVNLYKQQRRWAWGVENTPFMIWNFWDNKKIAFKQKFRYIFNQFEGMYSWATAPILILIFGRLPLWLSAKQIKTSVIAQNAPFIMERLMQIAMFGLILSMILYVLLLPKRPDRQPKAKFIIMILQWLLLPISMIVVGSFPAIDAQTRLMLGKYLGFWVTEKERK